jgi:hypothetical protein
MMGGGPGSIYAKYAYDAIDQFLLRKIAGQKYASGSIQDCCWLDGGACRRYQNAQHGGRRSHDWK